jgi:peptidoglycan/xylan/chitin deacetylase (PgdA/CDA1 family)
MRPHGVMFHYFHDHRHPPGEGALSADDLAEIIRYLGPERILRAPRWLQHALDDTLQPDEICLTFDDNLRCQYDVALPVLQQFGLTAFWFTPTAVLNGGLSRLEIYRRFRVERFREVNDFYEAFFRTLATSQYAGRVEVALARFDPSSYLADFAFYSEADRRYRFVRDEVLAAEEFHALMDMLIAAQGLKLEDLTQQLWMEPHHLRRLHSEGHVIGLHTHTHPTRLERLSPQDQMREYRENQNVLSSLLEDAPITMAHPCNSYNAETLAILRRLDVRLGFCSNMKKRDASALECPRLDAADVLRDIRRGVAPPTAQVAR